MIRVLLVDDHTMIRKGLRVLLESYSQIKIVGESHTGNDAILKANQLKPDVVLMDLSLPNGLDGFTASNEIRKSNPLVKIVILTMHDEEIFVQKAITVGAHGYILKTAMENCCFKPLWRFTEASAFTRLLYRKKSSIYGSDRMPRRCLLF